MMRIRVNFTDLLINGLIFLVALFAVCTTNCRTVLLPVFVIFSLMLLRNLFRQKIQSSYSNFSRSEIFYCILLLLFAYLFTHKTYIERDFYYYDSISVENLLNGIEDIDFISDKVNIHERYHYFDLWFNAILIESLNHLNVPITLGYYFSYSEFLFLLALLIFIFFRIDIRLKIYSKFFLTLLIIGISDMSWLECIGFKVDYFNFLRHPLKNGLLFLILFQLFDAILKCDWLKFGAYSIFFFAHSPLFHVAGILLMTVVVFLLRFTKMKVNWLKTFFFCSIFLISFIIIKYHSIILYKYDSINVGINPLDIYISSFFEFPVFRLKLGVSNLRGVIPYLVFFIILLAPLFRARDSQKNILLYICLLFGICLSILISMLYQLGDVTQILFLFLSSVVSLMYFIYFALINDDLSNFL